MGLFWKKKNSILDQIKGLLTATDKCSELFEKCMINLINEGPSSVNKESAYRVHDAESRIDDILRNIELDLYKNALIPESRGDVLGLLESFEKIPNKFESLCFQMSLQKIEIPMDLRGKFLRLLSVNLDSYKLINEAVMGLFYETDVEAQIDRIDKIESESDLIERDLIEAIFDLEIEKADKLLLRDITINIGDISDCAQSTTDRLHLTLIKRRM